MLILTVFFFFRILGVLTEKQTDKKKNTLRFSIMNIRISIIFTHLRSKLTSEICQNVGSLDDKTEDNRLQISLNSNLK